MTITLHMTDFSPPVRAVLLTAKALGITLEHKEVNLLKGEHRQPEYLKMNPQHTVPTLDDNGFIMWESHAIMAYLVGKYGKDDRLYPKDLKKRAVVDQRLYFETGVLFKIEQENVRAIFFQKQKVIPQAYVDSANEALSFLEKFLENSEWVAGETVTIADFSLIASVTTLNILIPMDPEKYPRVTAWIKRAEKLPYYDQNKTGLCSFKTLIEQALQN